MDKSEDQPLPEQPDFQGKLTAQEKRYLGMWLEVSDFMNMRPPGHGKGGILELLVIQDGRTNIIENFDQAESLKNSGRNYGMGKETPRHALVSFMRQVNIRTHFTLLSLAFIFAALDTRAADPPAFTVITNTSDSAPDRWCVYQEMGLMTGYGRAVIHTNGSIFIWTQSKPTTWGVEINATPDAQEKLTPEEQRSLGMWLEVTDFINARAVRSLNDAAAELWVYENGKTNLLSVNQEPAFSILYEFFQRMMRNDADQSSLSSRRQHLLNAKVGKWEYGDVLLALLKGYFRAPKRADYASEALRVLSLSMPARDWGLFVQGCLHQAKPETRAILMEAIQGAEWKLQERVGDEKRRELAFATKNMDIGYVPLPLELPKYRNTSDMSIYEPAAGPNVEAWPTKPRKPFLAPKGVSNVALGKKVTSSATKPPHLGSLSQITDGKKEPDDMDVVELQKGLQWVQIDLEKEYAIYAIALWHNTNFRDAYHDVVVQLSEDPEFKQDVQTVFNNDYDNSAGLGKGTDKEYPEHDEGKLIDTKGVKARYARFYSNGSHFLGKVNCYQEIEIYGLPAQ